MATINKIMVGVDDEIIELTGAAKVAYLAQKALDDEILANEKAQAEAKASAKAAAQAKLAALGLTVEDLQALGLGGN